MSSIREVIKIGKISVSGAILCALTGVIGVAAVSGCQSYSQTTVAKYEPTPIPEDEAMKHRDWSQSSLTYTSTAVSHWPTHFAYRPEASMNDGERLVAEPIIFLGQVIAFPAMLFVDPPPPAGVYHESRGEISAATFTANPPTPGTTQPSPMAAFNPPLGPEASIEILQVKKPAMETRDVVPTSEVAAPTAPPVTTPAAAPVGAPMVPAAGGQSPAVVPIPVPPSGSQGAAAGKGQ